MHNMLMYKIIETSNEHATMHVSVVGKDMSCYSWWTHVWLSLEVQNSMSILECGLDLEQDWCLMMPDDMQMTNKCIGIP